MGLDVAHRHMNPSDLYVHTREMYYVVAVLQEALSRDLNRNPRMKASQFARARREIVSAPLFRTSIIFVMTAWPMRIDRQWNTSRCFDETQRAWNLKQTQAFMARKKGRHRSLSQNRSF